MIGAFSFDIVFLLPKICAAVNKEYSLRKMNHYSRENGKAQQIRSTAPILASVLSINKKALAEANAFLLI